jgi:hypothetical protein
MGMDLISIDEESSFSTNWYGYRNIIGLLNELKCDISEVEMANHGSKVKKQTCRDWCTILIEKLETGKIKTFHVSDNNYHGGGYEKIVYAELYKNEELHDLSPHESIWLKEFCNFLNDCNGFKQY